MRNLFKLLAVVFFAATSLTFAQFPGTGITIGAGAGVSRGVNESYDKYRNFDFLCGGNILWNDAIAPGLTPEFALHFYDNTTSDKEFPFHYETKFVSADLRLRWEMLRIGNLVPTLFAGVGVSHFTIKEQDLVYDPTRPRGTNESEMAVIFPVGMAFKYEFTPRFSAELNGGVYLSNSDNFNPPHDEYNDASWFGKIGISYKIFDFAKAEVVKEDLDTDKDGILDKDEAQYGTNPMNPDTDGDGLFDGEEVFKFKTDPLDPDTDKGGVKDGAEVVNGADPLNPEDDIFGVQVGEKIILKNIEFVTGKSEITPRSEKILQIVLSAMNKIPTMEFEIVGHTDKVGNADRNKTLSQQRAESVKAWLVARGINANRLIPIGMGQDEPLVPNTSDENKQKNRRVEFRRSK